MSSSFHFKMNVLIKIFCWIVILPTIKSSCVVKYTNDIDIAPQFERVIGKFKIKVPFFLSDPYNEIKIYDGETLHGYCKSYFSPIIYETTENKYYYEEETVQKNISHETNIQLTCRGSSLFYDSHELNDQLLWCLEQKWSIYSSNNCGWCERNLNSSTFFYAEETATNNHNNILATICFNMDQLSLQTLVYNTSSVQPNYLDKPVDANDVVSATYLDEKLTNFIDFIDSYSSKTDLQKKLDDMGRTEHWLNLANYEVALITQNELLLKHFKNYSSILNIFWWRNLLVGNWKRFQNTLTSYSHNNSFEVYVGTSGAVQYPTDNNCNSGKYLEFNLGYRNETVPSYIWSYLKSNDNLNKEFIIVGYNSPYAEHFGIEKVVFCPDICSEIPWLKNVSTTFRYVNAGIMFCCSPDFIRQTNYLQGFPIDILQTEQITTTADIFANDIEESNVEYTTEHAEDI